MVMKTIEEIEKYAKEKYVPIARKDLVSYLIKLTKENGYKKVLECGSGIGYTSIQLALIEGVHVNTFEYFQPRYEVCVENIKDFGLEDKICLSDKNILDATLDSDYDLIFIDGAKKHTVEIFNFLKNKIKDNGTIIVDNIDLEVVNKIEVESKKIKYQQIAKETKEYFENITEYNAIYMPLGDGIFKVTKK